MAPQAATQAAPQALFAATQALPAAPHAPAPRPPPESVWGFQWQEWPVPALPLVGDEAATDTTEPYPFCHWTYQWDGARTELVPESFTIKWPQGEEIDVPRLSATLAVVEGLFASRLEPGKAVVWHVSQSGATRRIAWTVGWSTPSE